MNARFDHKGSIRRKRALVAADRLGDKLRRRQVGMHGAAGEHAGSTQGRDGRVRGKGIWLDGHWQAPWRTAAGGRMVFI